MSQIDQSTFQSLLVIMVLTYPIKLFALWRAARGDQKIWFGALAVLNTFGMLDLAYLFYFAKDKQRHNRSKNTKKDEGSH